MVETLIVIGRIILGVYWINVAYNHFMHTSMMAGYAQSKGIKSGKAAVIGSGILALLGGLSILLGAWPRVGAGLLVIFLLGVTFGMHRYWKDTDPQTRQMNQIQFNKNCALIGSLLIICAAPIPWVLGIIN